MMRWMAGMVLGLGLACGSAGGWHLDTSTDPMTDKTRRMAVTKAEQGGDGLSFMCTEGDTPKMLVLSHTIPARDDGVLKIRIGAAEPENWNMIRTEKALVVDMDRATAARLAEADRIAIQYHSLGGGSESAIFSMAGFRDAFATVVTPPCVWE